MYQKEIGIITKWWKKSNLMKKVSFARDRLVESYIWSLVFCHRLEYNKGRMFEKKMMACATIIDDTYDAYGTIKEAIQNEILISLELFHNIFKLIKCYMVEAKWCHEGFIPTYDEYKVNGILTSIFTPLMASFIGLGEFTTKDVFDWIFSNPTIMEAVSIIARVLNDMSSHKFEQQTAHVASPIECCMKQYCVSQAETCNLICKDVEDYWKVINKEYNMSIDIPKSVLDCVVNYASMSEVTYKNYQDKFINGELLKDYVSSFLMNPIFIDQH
ncbi:putative sesquiterpene synthase, partial [Mucuna pruriens]